MLKGNVEYYDKKSTEILFVADNVTLLVLNAVDGSIITTVNE